MTGFHEDQLAYFANPKSLIGERRRVGGIGQEYEVVGILDDETGLIVIPSWDEPLPYPVREIVLDIAGDCSHDRFLPLIGQYRSMGPDGPEYEVVSVESATKAKIWIVGNEMNDDYDIEDILIDPIVYSTT